MADEEITKRHFNIPDVNWDQFVARITKLAKRAAKLGLPPVTFDRVGSEVKNVQLQSDEARVATNVSALVHQVEVTGVRPVLSGWRFCGKLEHLPGIQEPIIKELQGGDVPKQYFSCGPNCDHCQTARNRKDTFVIRHGESGEYKQIGGSCIQDFFGGKSPEAVAAFFETLYDELDSLTGYESAGEISPQSRYYPTLRTLALAAAAVRVDGRYISSKESEAQQVTSTGVLVRMNLTMPPHSLRPDETIRVTEEDQVKAEEVLAWLKSPEVAAKADMYFRNLRVMSEADAVSYKSIPIYASAVAAHANEMTRKLTQVATENSQYVGEQGAKIDLRVTVAGVKTIPGAFGDKLLYRFVDQEGNLAVWFCSGYGFSFAIGEEYAIRGTVKNHEEYRGVKQTTLERVSCPDFKIYDWVCDYSGDAKAFGKKLKTVTDINIVNSNGLTPFVFAVLNGNTGAALELLKFGAVLDAKMKDGSDVRLLNEASYAEVANAAYLEGLAMPPSGSSFGFIECPKESLQVLQGLGVYTSAYSEGRRGVWAEVPAAVADQVREFSADFKSDVRVYDALDPLAVEAFAEYQCAVAPTDALAEAWQQELADVRAELSATVAPGAPAPQSNISRPEVE